MASHKDYPIVRLRYIDSTISDRQGSIQDEINPQVSEVVGFLIRETKEKIEVARELFRDGHYVERRGLLSVPRCALRGTVRRIRGE